MIDWQRTLVTSAPRKIDTTSPEEREGNALSCEISSSPAIFQTIARGLVWNSWTKRKRSQTCIKEIARTYISLSMNDYGTLILYRSNPFARYPREKIKHGSRKATLEAISEGKVGESLVRAPVQS